MQNHDIQQILARIREKDPAGFELLYQHYFRFLFSVAYSVSNSEEDSYDIIQSVMLRLYQLEANLFPKDHELSWLKTVVKNEALMHLRRKKADISLEETAEIPVMDQKIEDFVDMDAFHRLTDTLNQRQKRVVTLKILGDMTHKEIAQKRLRSSSPSPLALCSGSTAPPSKNCAVSYPPLPFLLSCSAAALGINSCGICKPSRRHLAMWKLMAFQQRPLSPLG